MRDIEEIKLKIKELSENIKKIEKDLKAESFKVSKHLNTHISSDVKLQKIMKEFDNMGSLKNHVKKLECQIEKLSKSQCNNSLNFSKKQEEIEDKILKIETSLVYITKVLDAENSRYRINIIGWLTLAVATIGSIWGVGVWGLDRFDAKEVKIQAKYDTLRVYTDNEIKKFDNKINKIDDKINTMLEYMFKSKIKQTNFGEFESGGKIKTRKDKYPIDLLYDVDRFFIWDNVEDRNSIQYIASKKNIKVSCRKLENNKLLVIRVK